MIFVSMQWLKVARLTLRVAGMETQSVEWMMISAALWTVFFSVILSAVVFAIETWKQENEDQDLENNDDSSMALLPIRPAAPVAPAPSMTLPPSDGDWELIDDDQQQLRSPGGRNFKTVSSSKAARIRLQYHRRLMSLIHN